MVELLPRGDEGDVLQVAARKLLDCVLNLDCLSTSTRLMAPAGSARIVEHSVLRAVRYIVLGDRAAVAS